VKNINLLKNRLLTATLLVPLVILGVLYSPPFVFAALSGSVFILGAWEWTRCAGFSSHWDRIRGLFLMGLLPLILLALLGWLGKAGLPENIVMVIFIFSFWLFALIFVFQYPHPVLVKFFKHPLVGIVVGALVLVPSWFFLLVLERLNPHFVLYVFFLVWTSDTAAYFVGRRFGKHKLAPKLSPGKTIEGVLGALIAGFCVIVLGYILLEQNLGFFPWTVLGFLTIVFSIVGDLLESAFKRMRNLKDSGSLLPGHGGILDRIDSLTAALPIFTLGFMFFN
jgi:phosphatidate cytidylyltransferase